MDVMVGVRWGALPTLSLQDDNQTLSVLGVGGLIVIVAVTLIVKAYRIRAENKNKVA